MMKSIIASEGSLSWSWKEDTKSIGEELPQWWVFIVVYSCNSYPHGCSCGYFGYPVKVCTCSATVIVRNQRRISEPLLDRIDIHIEMPCLVYEKLADRRGVESSTTIRARVRARERQLLQLHLSARA